MRPDKFSSMNEDSYVAYCWAYLCVYLPGLGFEDEERQAWNSGVVFW